MSQQQICSNSSEAVELFDPKGLYLKPIAKLNISVTLPQLKTGNKSISNWEVMEKLRRMVKPDQFLLLRVIKNSLEFIRFEAEIETRAHIRVFLARLHGKVIKLNGFTEVLKVAAAESKGNFPTRHDWDAFFRDATNMNESVPGERPDTIHLENLPCKWFAMESEPDHPSLLVVKMVFQTFGEIRSIDIPMLDPYRHENQVAGGTFKTFSFGNNITFEAYVQYMEYIGFKKAMDAMKGMKLLRKNPDGNSFTAEMKVDYDRTKHMSPKTIRKRERDRNRLIQLEKEREEEKKRERKEEQKRAEKERRRKELEELERKKRKQLHLTRKTQRQQVREERRRQRREEKRMQKKIALEERKLLLAQRKLESIRLLTELLLRAKVEKQHEELQKRIEDLEKEKQRQLEEERRRKEEEKSKTLKREAKKARQLKRKEERLRRKLELKVKAEKEKKLAKQMEEQRQNAALKGKMRSAVIKTSAVDEDESTNKLVSVIGARPLQEHEYFDSVQGRYITVWR